MRELPVPVQEALYNLECPSERGVGAARASRHNPMIPGDQVVFYAFNYGCVGAIGFASGLPSACLEKAAAQRGWRPKSRALLRAVMSYRGL